MFITLAPPFITRKHSLCPYFYNQLWAYIRRLFEVQHFNQVNTVFLIISLWSSLIILLLLVAVAIDILLTSRRFLGMWISGSPAMTGQLSICGYLTLPPSLDVGVQGPDCCRSNFCWLNFWTLFYRPKWDYQLSDRYLGSQENWSVASQWPSKFLLLKPMNVPIQQSS